MSSLKRNLTARFLQAIRPPKEGSDVYGDTAIPAFGIHVYSSGKMTWRLMYRVSGRQRNKKLGVYPTLLLADARAEARRILSAASTGIDVFDERRKSANRPTFGWVANEYLEKWAKREKRQWRTDERLINKELLPKWKHLAADEITRGDVIALLDGIVARNAPIQANRVRSLISMIFNWAIGRNLLEHNPAYKVPPPTSENQRARVLTKEEITSLWAAFDEQNPYIAAIFKVMLLTAQRRWEVSHMRWQDLDLEQGWWTIPGEFAKNGQSHRVPLIRAALDIIKSLPQPAVWSEWVFPSPTRKGQSISNVQKAKQRVDRISGVRDFVLHDLRRTASSYMASDGVSDFVVGRILNHSVPGVTKVYNRYSYDREKREGLETWGKRLGEMVGGFERPSGQYRT